MTKMSSVLKVSKFSLFFYCNSYIDPNIQHSLLFSCLDLPNTAVKLAGMAFDHDGNGGVTKEEIIETLAKTDVANVITSEAFKWAFEAADLDDNGTLDGDGKSFFSHFDKTWISL